MKLTLSSPAVVWTSILSHHELRSTEGNNGILINKINPFLHGGCSDLDLSFPAVAAIWTSILSRHELRSTEGNNGILINKINP